VNKLTSTGQRYSHTGIEGPGSQDNQQCTRCLTRVTINIQQVIWFAVLYIAANVYLTHR